jgi:hypothetical protein
MVGIYGPEIYRRRDLLRDVGRKVVLGLGAPGVGVVDLGPPAEVVMGD